jgi:oligopeptide transport system substrate-binding protein
MAIFLKNKKLIGLGVAALLLAGCTQVQRPVAEPYLATTTPPPRQEFRWSNGKLPKSIDPARAAAAPESDIVRAVFEGLTELDPKTLEAVPALAEKYSSSEDQKTWTFHLRKNAHWSNGKRVTANDLVSSWKRLRDIGDKAAHFELTTNIVGFKVNAPTVQTPQSSPGAALSLQEQIAARPHTAGTPADDTHAGEVKYEKRFGVVAVDDSTLEVTLEYTDADFPRLVADPIFRPVYGDGETLAVDHIDKTTVTNGPFKISGAGKDGVLLECSDSYWNKAAVKLDAVRFVPFETAEAALEAYKRGEIDAVTNAAFEPLALKLLAPYEDFRQTQHNALNFYEFNQARPPFSDRRVRSALSYAIDRAKLAEVELEGAAVPADRLLLLGDDDGERLTLDVETARGLLENAGFPNGNNFPTIRLVINRNETQQRLARAVAKMWRQNLSLETEIIVKENTEMDAAKASGDFDLIRRNAVLPTPDEFANLTAICGTALRPMVDGVPTQPARSDERRGPSEPNAPETPEPKFAPVTEADLMYDATVIPLYFPMSYLIVKPYVVGFETNAIDAVLLKDVQIDSNWQPKARRVES